MVGLTNGLHLLEVLLGAASSQLKPSLSEARGRLTKLRMALKCTEFTRTAAPQGYASSKMAGERKLHAAYSRGAGVYHAGVSERKLPLSHTGSLSQTWKVLSAVVAALSGMNSHADFREKSHKYTQSAHLQTFTHMNELTCGHMWAMSNTHYQLLSSLGQA